jgi:dTDP-4-amino-4,6-dideoxygalactose transaminase
MLSDIQDRGIGVSVHFRPIHLLTYYRKKFGYEEGTFPVAEAIGGSTLSLPLYPSLQEEELQYVAQTVRDVLPA